MGHVGTKIYEKVYGPHGARDMDQYVKLCTIAPSLGQMDPSSSPETEHYALTIASPLLLVTNNHLNAAHDREAQCLNYDNLHLFTEQ